MVEENVKEWLGNDELAIKIWNNKYRVGNETLTQWFHRVSGGNAVIEKYIKEKKFLFGGRILANRGVKDRRVTLSNCYVMPPPEDTLESIFDTAGQLAKTYSAGGGCGVDMSNLRPNGAFVNNAAKHSTGPVSFMDVFSNVTGTISQAGRRGALMLSIDVRHPDIEEFVDAKKNTDKVTFANISVRVGDDFMLAVKHDTDYILSWPCGSITGLTDIQDFKYGVLYETGDGRYFKKIRARQLFNKLVENNWDYAEPGILYWDRIQNYNLLQNTGLEYAGVNPCKPMCTA